MCAYIGTNSRLTWVPDASSDEPVFLRLSRILNGDGTKPDIRGVYQSAEIKTVNRPSCCTVTRKGVKSPLF